MKEGKAKLENKGLVVLLCVLLVAIVGLGAGVGINNLVKDVVVENDNSVNGGVKALMISEDIQNKLYNEPDYSVDDAINDYEYAINSSNDDTYRVYTTMDYADFVYDLYGDIDMAIEIMSRVEGLLGTNELLIDYYVTMSSFYEQAGDFEKMELYNQKVADLVPVREMTQKEIENEESNNV